MLICNVSLRAPHRAISSQLSEVASAVDATATGNVVFATLVDDPASVGDAVNAYLGETMVEAASASDSVLVSGGVVAASVVEPATAGDVVTALVINSAELAEAATADSTQDATAFSFLTWDAATAVAVTLSSGNLVATSTGTTSANQGARGANASGKTSGKYYFEITHSTAAAGGNIGLGIGTTGSTYTTMGGSATTGNISYRNSGNIWANGSNTGITISGYSGTPQIVFFAVDLDNRKIWFRRGLAGNWNNSGTADPATNVGGITIPAGTMVPFCVFGGSGGTAGTVFTANFGASAFTGTVPSGFTPGWVN